MKNKFVFVCLTPYQAFIAYTYIKELEKQTDVKYLVVFVRGENYFEVNEEMFSNNEVVTIPELFSNSIKRYWKRLYYGGVLFKLSKLSKIINKNTTLLIFNDTEPVTWKLMRETKEKSKSNKVILIEEGVGLYNFSSPKKNSVNIILKLLLTRLTGNKIKFRPIGMSEEIDAIIAREPLNIPKSKINNKKILRQSIGGIFSVENIMGFTNYIIEDDQLNFQFKEGDSKTILFLGQPISNAKDEIVFLRKLFSALPNDVRVIIKPHPRDNVMKYRELEKLFINLFIMNEMLAQVPVELLIYIFRDSLVLTYNSSAGINAKYIVPNIKVCFLYKCLNNYIKDEKNKLDLKSNSIMKNLISDSSIIANNINEIEDVVIDWLKAKSKNIINNKNDEFDGEEIEYFVCLAINK